MRALAQLVESRRRLVGDTVRRTHRLTSALKNSFPQVLPWFDDKETPLFCDFLRRWPTLKAAQLARRSTLEAFFREHHVRSADVIAQRLQAIQSATALTPDAGLVTPHALLVHAQGHPDFPLFNALPGAGAVFAPHLLVAFGAQRDRYTSADALQKYAGMAPVTERSGKKSWGHWRLQCPKFLRQTFIAWAAASIRHAFWAQAYDQQQRDKGKAHQTAVRALAFKGIRILYRCWQDRTPYNESISLQALQRRRAPLLLSLVHGSGKDEKTLTAPLRACVRRCAMPPSLKAATAHRMTAPPVCGCQPLQGPVVQHKPWHLLEVTPIPGDQHDVLHQRRRRNAEIATAHAQPHRT